MGTNITGGQIKDGTIKDADVAADAAISISKLDSTVASKSYVDSSITGTTIPSGSVQMYAGTAAPSGWLTCDGSNNIDRATYSALGTVLAPSKGNPTLTIASPCVVTLNSHGLATNDTVWLETTGALPTGLTAATLYYVKKIDANTFNLATTAGGASINTSGTQSGTHTLYYTIWGAPSAAGKFKLPDLRGRAPIGVGTGSGLTARSLAGTGGEETHTLTTSEMPAHAHTDSGHTHSNTATGPGKFSAYCASGSTQAGQTTTGFVDNTSTGVSTGITMSNASGTANIGNTGGGNSHNVMQPWLALNFIIKT